MHEKGSVQDVSKKRLKAAPAPLSHSLTQQCTEDMDMIQAGKVSGLSKADSNEIDRRSFKIHARSIVGFPTKVECGLPLSSLQLIEYFSIFCKKEKDRPNLLFILSISILSCKQCCPNTLIYPQLSKMLYPKVFLVFFDM